MGSEQRRPLRSGLARHCVLAGQSCHFHVRISFEVQELRLRSIFRVHFTIFFMFICTLEGLLAHVRNTPDFLFLFLYLKTVVGYELVLRIIMSSKISLLFDSYYGKLAWLVYWHFCLWYWCRKLSSLGLNGMMQGWVLQNLNYLQVV